jgi:hypothetical protein
MKDHRFAGLARAILEMPREQDGTFEREDEAIYPTWPKLEHQTTFHLPPHGPVVFAATVPPDVEIVFEDDNVQSVYFEKTSWASHHAHVPAPAPERALSDRKHTLSFSVGSPPCSTAMRPSMRCVFLGETEGRFGQVIEDFKAGRLRRVYDFMGDPPPTEWIGPARRDLLHRPLYNYRGVQMVDLVHASRGCRFNCFPCCSAFLGGKQFRPRPIGKVVEELEQIENNRLFVVDNSLAQDRDWLVALFTAIKPLKKKWVSHPILYDEEIIRLAAEAGCWYVYQAVFDTSNVIRDRIRMLQDTGSAWKARSCSARTITTWTLSSVSSISCARSGWISRSSRS